MKYKAWVLILFLGTIAVLADHPVTDTIIRASVVVKQTELENVVQSGDGTITHVHGSVTLWGDDDAATSHPHREGTAPILTNDDVYKRSFPPLSINVIDIRRVYYHEGAGAPPDFPVPADPPIDPPHGEVTEIKNPLIFQLNFENVVSEGFKDTSPYEHSVIVAGSPSTQEGVAQQGFASLIAASGDSLCSDMLPMYKPRGDFGSGDFTIRGEIFPRSFGSRQFIIGSRYEGYAYRVLLDAGKLVFEFTNGVETRVLRSLRNATLNEWNSFTIYRKDGETVLCLNRYHDDKIVYTDGIGNNGGQIHVGYHAGYGTIDGYLDAIEVWRIAIIPTPPLMAPDLAFVSGSFTIIPSPTYLRDTAGLSIAVQNVAASENNSWARDVEVVLYDYADTQLLRKLTPVEGLFTLPPGGVKELTFTWNTGNGRTTVVPPVNARLLFSIDPDNKIDESNKANNTHEETVVLRAKELPDLHVASFVLDGRVFPDPTEDVVVRATIVNLGETAADNVVCTVTANGNNHFFVPIQVIATLPGGNATELSWTFRPSAFGYARGDTISLTCAVDPENTIVENDEDNNSRDLKIPLALDQPDFVVIDCLAPAVVYPGVPFEVVWRVVNIGGNKGVTNVPAAAFLDVCSEVGGVPLDIELDQARALNISHSKILEGDITEGAPTAEELAKLWKVIPNFDDVVIEIRKKIRFNETQFPIGSTLDVVLSVDPNDDFNEANRANSVMHRHMKVLPPIGLVNLFHGQMPVVSNENPVAEKTTFTVSVAREGDLIDSALDTTVAITLVSTGAKLGDVAVHFDAGAIQKVVSVEVAMPWAYYRKHMSYEVEFLIDPANEIEESNEDDNRAVIMARYTDAYIYDVAITNFNTEKYTYEYGRENIKALVTIEDLSSAIIPQNERIKEVSLTITKNDGTVVYHNPSIFLNSLLNGVVVCELSWLSFYYEFTPPEVHILRAQIDVVDEKLAAKDNPANNSAECEFAFTTSSATLIAELLFDFETDFLKDTSGFDRDVEAQHLKQDALSSAHGIFSSRFEENNESRLTILPNTKISDKDLHANDYRIDFFMKTDVQVLQGKAPLLSCKLSTGESFIVSVYNGTIIFDDDVSFYTQDRAYKSETPSPVPLVESFTIPVNVWVQVSLVRKDKEMFFYLNGIPVCYGMLPEGSSFTGDLNFLYYDSVAFEMYTIDLAVTSADFLSLGYSYGDVATVLIGIEDLSDLQQIEHIFVSIQDSNQLTVWGEKIYLPDLADGVVTASFSTNSALKASLQTEERLFTVSAFIIDPTLAARDKNINNTRQVSFTLEPSVSSLIAQLLFDDRDNLGKDTSLYNRQVFVSSLTSALSSYQGAGACELAAVVNQAIAIGENVVSDKNLGNKNWVMSFFIKPKDGFLNQKTPLFRAKTIEGTWIVLSLFQGKLWFDTCVTFRSSSEPDFARFLENGNYIRAGEWNKIQLERTGDTITAYHNDTPVLQWTIGNIAFEGPTSFFNAGGI